MAFQQHIIIRAPTTLPMPIHMGNIGIPIGLQPVMTFQAPHHRQRVNILNLMISNRSDE